MAAPLVFMHAYPSAYTYRFDYVCLHCHLLMHICFCLWFLMFAYDIYACLCMFIYLLMGYDVSEGKFCWNYAVWRKGKWLVGILVLKLDKGICCQDPYFHTLTNGRQRNVSLILLCSSGLALGLRPLLSSPAWAILTQYTECLRSAAFLCCLLFSRSLVCSCLYSLEAC
jgi:hypothetical protein